MALVSLAVWNFSESTIPSTNSTNSQFLKIFEFFSNLISIDIVLFTTERGIRQCHGCRSDDFALGGIVLNLSVEIAVFSAKRTRK